MSHRHPTVQVGARRRRGELIVIACRPNDAMADLTSVGLLARCAWQRRKRREMREEAAVAVQPLPPPQRDGMLRAHRALS